MSGRRPASAGRPGGLRRVLAAVLLLIPVIAVGAGAYLARTKDVPVRGGVISEGVVLDISNPGGFSLLPAFADAPPARDVAALLYRGLTRTGPDGRPLPELATKWEVDAGVKTFTFHLRPGVRWSDGTKLSSADALYTLRVLQDAGLAQTQAGQAWGGVTATAPDPLTVVYSLPAPSAGFVNLTRVGLLPEHALKNRPAAALRDATDAPTSGPFRVESVARDRVALRRNRVSFEPPLIDGIDLKLFTNTSVAVQAFIAGDVDTLAGLTPTDAAAVGSAINRRLLTAGSFSYTELLFNQKQPALSDLGVRQAIGQAIDRRGEIQSTLKGYASLDNSPIPPTISWAAATNPGPTTQAAAAGAAFDRAGWKRPSPGKVRQKDGKDLRLQLSAPNLDPYSTIAKSIASDLTAIGVGVKLRLVPGTDLLQMLQARSFDLALTALHNGPDPDIYVLWHSSQSAEGGFNFSGMAADPSLDKDLEDGRFHFDIKTRKAAYLDAQKILRANDPAVFLYSPDVLVAFNDRVKGVRLNPAMESSGRYDYVSGWYLNSSRVWK
ncbi:MAG TPA: ABC transporter substrate-binding protein [Candidatus Solibacter sp.]|jgi:peptide/nickel transport system substrate-binding protein|nr:ABC transporter substrate-binding protein [Candidatus Solibacter sp.]